MNVPSGYMLACLKLGKLDVSRLQTMLRVTFEHRVGKEFDQLALGLV